MSFSGTWGPGERREVAAAAADSHWDQEWELKREEDAKKGAEATGMFLHSDVILDQTQGGWLGYHKSCLPRLVLSSDFEQITELRGGGGWACSIFGTGISAEPARAFWDCVRKPD